jgi:hypothetical protein
MLSNLVDSKTRSKGLEMDARNSVNRDARDYDWLHHLVQSSDSNNSETIAGRQRALIAVREREASILGDKSKVVSNRRQTR